jgi:hypothetical protein
VTDPEPLKAVLDPDNIPTCNRCGALLWNPALHHDWHQANDRTVIR